MQWLVAYNTIQFYNNFVHPLNRTLAAHVRKHKAIIPANFLYKNYMSTPTAIQLVSLPHTVLSNTNSYHLWPLPTLLSPSLWAALVLMTLLTYKIGAPPPA